MYQAVFTEYVNCLKEIFSYEELNQMLKYETNIFGTSMYLCIVIEQYLCSCCVHMLVNPSSLDHNIPSNLGQNNTKSLL